MELTKQMQDVAKQIFDIHVGSEFEQDPAGWLEAHFSHPEKAVQYAQWEAAYRTQITRVDVDPYYFYKSARIDDMAVSIEDCISQATPKLLEQFEDDDRDKIIEAVASRMFEQLEKQMHDVSDKVKAMVAEEPKRKQKREELEL